MGGGERFTIADMLGLDAFGEARLVSGRSGVARSIAHVAVLDTSDLDGVRKDQFLISNVYPMLDMDVSDLVRRLDLRGASGLGLKLSGYWPEVPEPMREESDHRRLPIVLLPDGPFDEVVNPLLAAIVERQTATLHELARFHNALTAAALLEDADPASIVRILTEAIGVPAALFSEVGPAIAFTGPEQVWRSERLARRVREATQATPVRDGGRRYFMAPVPGGRPGGGAICVHDLEPDDSFGVAAIAHAALVAGMLLVGRRRVETVHRRFERELLEDLVEGRIGDRPLARERAEAIGWPAGDPYLVLVASIGPDAAPEAPDARRDLMTALGRHVAAATERPVRVFPRRPGTGVVVHLRHDDDPAAVPSLARAGIDAAMGPDAAPARIGVSSTRHDPSQLAEAFREAAIAFTIGGPHGSSTARFEDVGPARLLARARDPEGLVARARRILGPLGDEAAGRRRDLFDTAAVLLSRNMRLSSTAQEMYFHYNTVRHRVARLQQLLGGRLGDPEGRLLLSLAVTALRLADVDRELGLRPPGDSGNDRD